MPLRTLGGSRVFSHDAFAAHNVLDVRDRFDMIRVTARMIPAQMILDVTRSSITDNEIVQNGMNS